MSKTTSANHTATITAAAQFRTWVVCESGDRWLIATRRFATVLMPENLAATIVRTEAADMRSLVTGQTRAVAFWEIGPENLAAAFQMIAQTSVAAPSVLQLAAVSGVSVRDQCALSELGLATMIQHTEQLPGLSKLVQRYFS